MKLQTIAPNATLLKNTLIASLVGALFVSVLNPEHTAHLPILTAYGLWATHLFFGAAIFVAAIYLVQRLGWSDPLPAMIATAVLPLLFALVSLALDYGFGNLDEDSAENLTGIALVLSEIIAVTPASLTIALALIFLLKSDEHTEAAQNADTPPPQPIETPVEINLRALLPGLPFDLGNDIIRMHAQDHYVEVTTTQGRSLLSEQFGDCLQKLDHLNGIHCHRSHWICLDHLRGITRKGSAYSCQLSNGDEVPISRRKYAEIKARLSSTPPS